MNMCLEKYEKYQCENGVDVFIFEEFFGEGICPIGSKLDPFSGYCFEEIDSSAYILGKMHRSWQHACRTLTAKIEECTGESPRLKLVQKSIRAQMQKMHEYYLPDEKEEILGYERYIKKARIRFHLKGETLSINLALNALDLAFQNSGFQGHVIKNSFECLNYENSCSGNISGGFLDIVLDVPVSSSKFLEKMTHHTNGYVLNIDVVYDFLPKAVKEPSF